MTFRFGNDETLETRTLAKLPVGIAGVNGVLRVYVVPGRPPLLLSKEFSRHLGCHIDLGRGHLFFEKLGVRTVVTSKQSPHLLLPLTSFGPQRDTRSRLKSSHASVKTNVQSTVPHVIALDRTKYIRRSPQYLTIEHLKLTAPTLNPCMERMDRRKKPCDEARDYWENREGRWVRVHSITRRTLFDPLHDEQPFCNNLAEHRRTTGQILGATERDDD